jgi:hypothetical protein
MRVEIDNVEEVLNRTVLGQGRITGLSDFVGKRVKVLILNGSISGSKGGKTT